MTNNNRSKITTPMTIETTPTPKNMTDKFTLILLHNYAICRSSYLMSSSIYFFDTNGTKEVYMSDEISQEYNQWKVGLSNLLKELL